MTRTDDWIAWGREHEKRADSMRRALESIASANPDEGGYAACLDAVKEIARAALREVSDGR